MARVRTVFLTPARTKAPDKEANAHDRSSETCGGDTEWGNEVIAMTLRKVKAALALPTAAPSTRSSRSPTPRRGRAVG